MLSKAKMYFDSYTFPGVYTTTLTLHFTRPTILNGQCCSHYMIPVCWAIVDIDHTQESSEDEMPLQDPAHIAKEQVRTEQRQTQQAVEQFQDPAWQRPSCRRCVEGRTERLAEEKGKFLYSAISKMLYTLLP